MIKNSIPIAIKAKVALGLFLAITIALPLFVWTAINVNFNVNKRAQGEPNFCGGTCGSNFNCQPNFFCYIENGQTSGYCRNPICAQDTDCICNTPTATALSTAVSTKTAAAKTASPSISPTLEPKGGSLNTTSPTKPTSSPDFNVIKDNLSDDLDRDDGENGVENKWLSNFAKYTIFFAIALGLIIAIVIISKVVRSKKDNIPHIVPPQNI